MPCESDVVRLVKRGRLSKDEVTKITELAERGWSPGRIASKLTRHPSTISHHMTTHGLRTPIKRRTRSYTRNGSNVVSFSEEEDAFIEALRVQSYTYSKIADIAGKRFAHQRSAATIGTRLKMLATL